MCTGVCLIYSESRDSLQSICSTVSVLPNSSQSRTGVRERHEGKSMGNLAVCSPECYCCVSRSLYQTFSQDANESLFFSSLCTGWSIPHSLYWHTLSCTSCLHINNTALAIINMGIVWFLFPCCQWIQKILTATLILEQTVPLDFCSDVKVWALCMDTQEDWPLPQLVKSYTSLDCLQTLLEDHGPEKVCAERLHILVNCLSGYG